MAYNKHIQSQPAIKVLEKIRILCQSLPQAEEIMDGFGHTTFKVNGKSFIIMGEDKEGASLSFKSDRETQAILLQQGSFFKTPYIGQHGWVSIKVDEMFDWNELSKLLEEAYLRAAPKRLVKHYLSEKNK